MSLVTPLVNLCLGKPARYKKGEPVLICTVEGCMVEKLTVRDEGVVLGKIKIPCSNGPDFLGIKVQRKDGTITSELLKRLRRLNDGRLVVAN